MNFIIRYETDGYVNINTRTSSSKIKNYTLKDIANIIEVLSISLINNSSSIIPTKSKLIIKKEG
jgi:hypothetical protein